MTSQNFYKIFLLLCFPGFLFQCKEAEKVQVYKKWHKLTLSFKGPQSSEMDSINPFLDYRLDVKFTNGGVSYLVPGFYAADGNAGETSADKGNIWQVRFIPDKEGTWTYTVSFKKGKNVAVSENQKGGESTGFDGQTGSFKVVTEEKDKGTSYGKGRLKYTGKRYLQYAESGEYFLKGGADSPENFLAYHDFDSTYPHGQYHYVKSYEKHLGDWKEGDPTWKNGKGKAIIGALNYLASEKMNVVYFLTMNVNGDSKDVWPWVSHADPLHYDVSKLDQWEKVFDHMDKLGIMLHIVTQETENDSLLNLGNMGLERKLYYRELIARFSSHLGITWNLGEETNRKREQIKAYADYFKKTDPYQHLVVIHNHVNKTDMRFTPLLGYENFDGPSLQIEHIEEVHKETVKWVEKSKESGRQWVVCLDEVGPWWRGVTGDNDNPDNYDSIRHLALYGNLLGGGAGVEWYFGGRTVSHDQNTDDWRTRDTLWDQTRYAMEFFHKNLPFWEMETADSILSGVEGYCFAKSNEVYAVYMHRAKEAKLDLREESYAFTVRWFDPVKGGSLLEGSVKTVDGGKEVSIGSPPNSDEHDWLVLVKRR